MNTIKRNIERDLKGIIKDCNHPTRRFFRCWIDGSYLGEKHYLHNLEEIGSAKNNPRRLRSFVIAAFSSYIAHDWGCTRGYASRVVTGFFSANELDALNAELIDDALDLLN